MGGWLVAPKECKVEAAGGGGRFPSNVGRLGGAAAAVFAVEAGEGAAVGEFVEGFKDGVGRFAAPTGFVAVTVDAGGAAGAGDGPVFLKRQRKGVG